MSSPNDYSPSEFLISTGRGSTVNCRKCSIAARGIRPMRADENAERCEDYLRDLLMWRETKTRSYLLQIPTSGNARKNIFSSQKMDRPPLFQSQTTGSNLPGSISKTSCGDYCTSAIRNQGPRFPTINGRRAVIMTRPWSIWSASGKIGIRSRPPRITPPPHKYYTIQLQDKFREHGLQIIVKMENIELTPDSGSYKGTDWRMKGQLNEHLVAAAVFAYDVANITEPRIAFRQNTKLDERFYRCSEDREQRRKVHPRHDVPAQQCGKYGSTEFAAVAEILGFSTADLDPCCNHAVKTWQDKGTVRVLQGRLVTFPNLLEHRYEPFALADPSRPGCFRFIVLYLVDPHYRVCSTRNVPPQQHHWWAESVSHNLAAAGLPQEIVDEIMQGTGSWPMGLPEARRHRREFLKEHRWNNLVRIYCMRRPSFDCY